MMTPAPISKIDGDLCTPDAPAARNIVGDVALTAQGIVVLGRLG